MQHFHYLHMLSMFLTFDKSDLLSFCIDLKVCLLISAVPCLVNCDLVSMWMALW